MQNLAAADCSDIANSGVGAWPVDEGDVEEDRWFPRLDNRLRCFYFPEKAYQAKSQKHCSSLSPKLSFASEEFPANRRNKLDPLSKTPQTPDH